MRIKSKEISLVKGNVIDYSLNKINDLSCTSTTIIIPHVCNNVNVFGAGFAKAIADRFPIVKENFHVLGKTEAKLGKVQLVTVAENNKTKNKVIVANMIAQNGIVNPKNKRPLNYAALVYCMNDIRKTYNHIRSQSEEYDIEIHAPKFGSGLAGGNWPFIEELIEDIWNDIAVFIYIPTFINKRN